MNKRFNGKAIYQPAGKAAEYAKWACNFYVGCSNSCTYCYCKRFKWGNVPKLKACFKDEKHALEVFEKELEANLTELQKHGLFFSFTSDWALNECIELTIKAIDICVENEVPVKLLSKRADWVDNVLPDINCLIERQDEILNEIESACEDCLADECPNYCYNKYLIETCKSDVRKEIEKQGKYKKYVAFGFSLSGHDELEPHASTNTQRIEAMRKLHEAGFKIFASIEPVIDFKKSEDVILNTLRYCDHYKIGLMSGKKYDKIDVDRFIRTVCYAFDYDGYKGTCYFKDSLLAQAGISRLELPDNCVSRDYDLFNH